MPQDEELHDIDVNVQLLNERVKILQEKMEDLVTKVEFAPVKLIAYGLATAVMSSVIVALMAKVLIK